MMYVFLFFLCMGTLTADISISVSADKERLTIDQQLNVNYTLSYPQDTPPDLFPFLYNLANAPQVSFRIVDSQVDQHRLQFRLQPLHTGELIFAPGIITFGNVPYLVPAVRADCAASGQTVLPIAGLLPLYPERKITISSENRMHLMSEKVLQGLRQQNLATISLYRKAWNLLALAMLGCTTSALVLWGMIYYELFQRAKIVPQQRETPLALLERRVQDPALDRTLRVALLGELLREALSVKDAKDLRHVGLFELADYIKDSPALTVQDKDVLMPIVTRVAAICYAASPTTDEEWAQMQKQLLSWLSL